MPWTKEGREYVLAHYGELSASTLASIVNKDYGCWGVTRNAVIGIAQRAGKCAPPDVRKIRAQAAAARKAEAARTRKGKKKPRWHPAVINGSAMLNPQQAPTGEKPEGIIVTFNTRPLPKVPLEPPLNLTLMELEPGQCRAPTGQNEEGLVLFCGRPQADHPAEGRAKRSWCAGHASLFHVVQVKKAGQKLWVPGDATPVKATPAALKALLAG